MQIIDAARMGGPGQTITTAARPRAAPEAKDEEEDEANVQDVRTIQWTITPLLVVLGIVVGTNSARPNTVKLTVQLYALYSIYIYVYSLVPPHHHHISGIVCAEGGG